MMRATKSVQSENARNFSLIFNESGYVPLRLANLNGSMTAIAVNGAILRQASTVGTSMMRAFYCSGSTAPECRNDRACWFVRQRSSVPPPPGTRQAVLHTWRTGRMYGKIVGSCRLNVGFVSCAEIQTEPLPIAHGLRNRRWPNLTLPSFAKIAARSARAGKAAAIPAAPGIASSRKARHRG